MHLIQSVTDWFTESLLNRSHPDVLELGTRSFRRLRGTFRDNRFFVEERAKVQAPSSFVLSSHLGSSIFDLSEFEDAVRGLYGAKIPKNRFISVIIPDQAFHVGLIALSAVLLHGSMQPIVEREVQSSSPRPLSEYQTTWEIGLGKGPKRNLLFSCLNHGTIEEVCQSFDHLGLLPLSIQPSFTQVTSLMKLLEPEASPHPSVLIHLGHEATTVVIILGGVIRRIQVLPLGAGDFTKALAKAMNVSFSDAEAWKHHEVILLEEPTSDAQGEVPAYVTLGPLFNELLTKIYNVLQMHTVEVPQEGTFRRIILSGGGSAFRNFDRLIAANLGLPVTTLGQLLKPMVSSASGPSSGSPLAEDVLSAIGPMIGGLHLQAWRSNRFDRMVA